ncbi:diacylglycerol/lipid kinase family protein [Pontiella sulfatireligans]|uniref:Lipid kinase BmrU n=1 Tax=Pontiella sulfatireligans TaxID=2750658 RepID=A0A6C2UKL5_9BACT|nr:diacylglycerol kinase family protein [Pontiella sulfatireligans]VGO19957.1 Putative lipid kinase BmrU [Pontiella sulfatireligans]
MDNILYIINPAGHGGAGMKAWGAFNAVWADPIDPAHVVITERPGHAREIAAAGEDYKIIAAVGGDGTVGEVISGIMDRPGPKPKLAVIPCGTGNDIARHAGIHSPADAAAALRSGQHRSFDLVRVDGTLDGSNAHRHAFLFANAGFSSTLRIKPWMKRVLGATGAYYLATLLEVLTFRAPRMTVRVDGEEYAGPTFLVVAGNAEWVAGGSMRLSPGAVTDDGELNVTIIPALSTFKIITQLGRIAKGTHINEPGVSYFTGRKIEVHSEPPSILDLDGEGFGTTPAIFTVCPLALELVCAASPT